jgi:GntR family transcriptional regulator
MTDETLQPLRTNKLSLSARAQQYLLRLVESGAYEPGEQLPSQADLAAQLGISRPTLREALLNLEQDGVIIRKHGVGTFVAPGYGERLETGLERLESVLQLASRQGMQPECTGLEVESAPADKEVAANLQVPVDTEVTHVRRVITVEGKPVAYLLDVVPSSVLAPSEIDERFAGSVLDLLRQKRTPALAQAVADIVALNAKPPLLEKLSVKRGQAILLLEEILLDEEGTIVGFSRNFFVPQFFRFHVVRS